MGLTLASIMVKHLQHFMFSGNSCTPKKSEKKKKNNGMSSWRYPRSSDSYSENKLLRPQVWISTPYKANIQAEMIIEYDKATQKGRYIHNFPN